MSAALKFTLVVFFLVALGFSELAFANEGELSSAFNNYQKSYQAGDFESAKTIIEEALKTHSHNSFLIYNLGLTEYKLGKVGLAIGLWRKALALNPQLNEARRAIDYAMSQASSRPLAQNTDSTWIWIEKLVQKHVSFNLLWPLFLICLFMSGYYLIRYFGEKRRAFENDGVAPVLGGRPILFFSLCLVLALLSFVSLKDLTATKATVITKPTEVRTGPSSDNATLFEIPEGTEVLIRDKDSGWYKIEDPTGRTGWTEDNNIFVTTENI